MALSPPRLVTPAVGGAGPSVTTAAFSPLANEDLIVVCFARSGTTVDLPTISDSASLTWSLQDTVSRGVVNRQRRWRVNVGASPPASMTVTCTATGSPQAVFTTVLGQSGSSGDYSNFSSATSAVSDLTLSLPVAPASDSIVIGWFGHAHASELTAGPAGHTLLTSIPGGLSARIWVGYDPAPPAASAFYDTAMSDRGSVAQLLEVKAVPGEAGAVSESLGLSASFDGQLAAGRAHSVTMAMDMTMTATIAGQGSPENPSGTWRGATRTWAMPSGVDPIAGDNLTFSSGGGSNWFNLPIRSGRASASGTAFWYDRSGNTPPQTIPPANRFASEEADVALIDSITGSSKGDGQASVATMNQVYGRTSGGADDFTDTQFDWRPQNFFGLGDGLLHLPTGGSFATDGSGWIFWVMTFVPGNRSTNSGDMSIYTEYAAGTHDALLLEFGDRLKRKIDATGHPRKRFILDAHHEMNQSNAYRIFAGSRDLYKSAMQRIIDKVREGAGFEVRFCHRPAYRPTDGQPGPYNSYIPSNVDVLSLSIHPGSDCDTSARVDQLFAGTLNSNYYGTDELIATAGEMNLPIAFPEWSPKFESSDACPVASTFYTKFFNNVIVPNRDILVADGVHNQNVRDLGAYQGTQSGGSTQWDTGVVTRKNLFSGIKSTSSAFVRVATPYWTTLPASSITRPAVNEQSPDTMNVTVATNRGIDLRDRHILIHRPGIQFEHTAIDNNMANGSVMFGVKIEGFHNPPEQVPSGRPNLAIWQMMKFGSSGQWITGALAGSQGKLAWDDASIKQTTTGSGDSYCECFSLIQPFDGIRAGAESNGKLILNTFYVREAIDEAIENDSYREIECNDFLIDGCHTFISTRRGNSSDVVTTHPMTFRNGLVRIGRLPPYFAGWGGGGDATPNPGSLFSGPYVNATNRGLPIITNSQAYGYAHANVWKDGPGHNGPVIMEDCVFYDQGLTLAGDAELRLPEKTGFRYTNVLYLYVGETPIVNNLPPGVTLNTNRAECDAIWARERDAWLLAHGNTALDGEDFDFLHQ